MAEKVRRTIDIDKELWHEVSVESAKMQIFKRDFIEEALREKLEKIKTTPK